MRGLACRGGARDASPARDYLDPAQQVRTSCPPVRGVYFGGFLGLGEYRSAKLGRFDVMAAKGAACAFPPWRADRGHKSKVVLCGRQLNREAVLSAGRFLR